ncbi:hypothetical protein PR202_gb00036 [Eleusine coracana subsp. coracana]|uniref:Uncharacterized protein n=1 Tax=Eleusine coracana subsp. coracana TaxID=191504 RepID=A0AAV5DSP5_ELECO|nr:hypothetical protein PR202_gb00036 [Eleusine coracana subsp. coracana]
MKSSYIDEADGTVHDVPHDGARVDVVRPQLQQPRRAQPARLHHRRPRRRVQLSQGHRQRVPGRRLVQGGRAPRRMRDLHQLRHLAQHGLQPVCALLLRSWRRQQGMGVGLLGDE